MNSDDYDQLDENAKAAVRDVLFDVINAAWAVDLDAPLPLKLVAGHPALADVGAHIATYLRSRGAESSEAAAVHDGYRSFQDYTHEVRSSLPHQLYAQLKGEMYRERMHLFDQLNDEREKHLQERELRDGDGQRTERELDIARQVLPAVLEIWGQLCALGGEATIRKPLRDLDRLGEGEDRPWLKLIEILRASGKLQREPEDLEVESIIRAVGGNTVCFWKPLVYQLVMYYSPPALLTELVQAPLPEPRPADTPE